MYKRLPRQPAIPLAAGTSRQTRISPLVLTVAVISFTKYSGIRNHPPGRKSVCTGVQQDVNSKARESQNCWHMR